MPPQPQPAAAAGGADPSEAEAVMADLRRRIFELRLGAAVQTLIDRPAQARGFRAQADRLQATLDLLRLAAEGASPQAMP